ncbi:MAG: DMT family transporter, partial [Oscillospiraceae bacterium]|nr:DMT family transporter [Oscillospiraceae bacterium]
IKSNQARSLLAALATVLMWSSAFPVTRFLLGYYSPGAIMVLRFIVACVILIVIGVVKKIRLPEKKDLPVFLAMGIFGVFAYNFLFNTGTIYVVSGVSSFIVASAPVFTLILARLLLKEVVRPAVWLGVAVSFTGLMVVMFSQTQGLALNVGVLMLVGAAISGSVLNITQRVLVRKYTALECTTYGIIVGTIFMFIYLPGAITELAQSTVPANLAIIFMAVFPAVLAYISWGYALSKAEKTTHVTVFLYLVPFLSSIIGFIWLGETFSLWALLGGVVIITGMIISNVIGRTKQK